MKKYRFLSFILVLLMLVVCVPGASAIEDAPEVKAGHVMLISMNTGAVIYEKGADEQIYPASTTKLMTMAVAIDLISDLQETLTFDKKEAYSDLVIGSSNMGLKDGEIITLEDVLYGIAISSANEGTNAIAIHLCGSISAFVEKMNAKAAEWGMVNTHFVNTHGLTDENHYTTARDMSILARKVFTDERLLPYFTAGSYRLKETNKNDARTIVNTNALIRQNSGNYYKYAVAGKTGTTSAAGYNLVSTARYKGMEYLCVMMNADYSIKPNPVFEDTIKMFKWAFGNFSLQTLINETASVCEIPVSLCAKSDYVVLIPEKKIEAVIADDADINDRVKFEWVVNTEYNAKNPAMAPIEVGDVMGTVSIVERDAAGNILVDYGTVNLVASTKLERSTILYYLHLIRNFFKNPIVMIVGIILVIAIIVYIIIMILQNRNRRRRKIARRIRF